MGYNTLALVAYAAIMHSSATSDTLHTHTPRVEVEWEGEISGQRRESHLGSLELHMTP